MLKLDFRATAAHFVNIFVFLQISQTQTYQQLVDFSIQRAELLNQECCTEKVASNIHRLGPKNTQKVANELINDKAPPSVAPHRGRRFAPPTVGIVFQFIGNLLCIFCAQPVYVASYFSCVTLLLQ